MNPNLTKSSVRFWKRLNLADRMALLIFALCAGLWGLPSEDLPARTAGFVLFLALCALGYLAFRGFLWANEHLLWSLRNQLVTAYLFIAVVPVLLLLTMAGLAAYLLYWQLGSYVIYTEMDERVERVGAVAGAMARSYAVEIVSGRSAAALALPEDVGTYLKNAMTELPGLKIETGTGDELLPKNGEAATNRYQGIVFRGGTLSLQGVVARETPSGHIIVLASVPVTPEFLESLAPELGPIEFDVLRPQRSGLTHEVSVVVDRRSYARVQGIATVGRSVPRAANPFDKLITGIVNLDVLDQDSSPGQVAPTRLLVSFRTRPSLLNARLFSPLGQLGGAAATALLVLGTVFLLIEIGSLVTGIVMTRTITTTVDELYRATQHVQAGDLTFRVQVPNRDQLAALGESFNSMTNSVSTLIEEQRQRQRLQTELSIAHEVQQQLFPHALPELPGLEVEAICQAARTVSGDYYDFIRISPTRLAIALADISGKGISAALLMANAQAALRSDVLRYRDGQPGNHRAEINTGAIVSHLNRHLFRNSSEERYATMFFGVYDTETRNLSYTNGGHPPPLYICGDRVERLETGGMVVGLFNDVPFEQAVVEMEPDSLLVAYSDGLIESENVHGEEFGTQRLIGVAKDNRDATPHVIAEALIHAAEAWSSRPGSPIAEQSDDMTVIVLHFSPSPQELHA